VGWGPSSDFDGRWPSLVMTLARAPVGIRKILPRGGVPAIAPMTFEDSDLSRRGPVHRGGAALPTFSRGGSAITDDCSGSQAERCLPLVLDAVGPSLAIGA
jgi:hypothetical protein